MYTSSTLHKVLTDWMFFQLPNDQIYPMTEPGRTKGTLQIFTDDDDTSCELCHFAIPPDGSLGWPRCSCGWRWTHQRRAQRLQELHPHPQTPTLLKHWKIAPKKLKNPDTLETLKICHEKNWKTLKNWIINTAFVICKQNKIDIESSNWLIKWLLLKNMLF